MNLSTYPQSFGTVFVIPKECVLKSLHDFRIEPLAQCGEAA